MIGKKVSFTLGGALLALSAPALAGGAAAAAGDAPAHADAAHATTPAPAPVTTTLTFGQAVEGNIVSSAQSCDATDPHVRLYSFAGTAGQRIEVTMNADDFDTVLEIGRFEGCTFTVLGTNDDGAGPDDGLNSRLTAHLPTTGTYVIRAKALADDAGGKFSLKLTQLPNAAAAPTPVAVTIGRNIRGNLTNADATISDSTDTTTITESSRPYQLYSLSGEAGQTYLIKLDSDEFDPIVDVGINSPLGFSVAASNDDGGGENDGLNSRLRVTFQSAGTLLVRVSPLSNDTGHYTLKVENAQPE